VPVGIAISTLNGTAGTRARETVHATVVCVRARPIPIVIGTARSISKCAKVVIEGMVLLHDDDNMIDPGQIAFQAVRRLL
jgi:hypothetical protein